jgi:DNA-directed RNA polymerase specialized sigma24 family protein
VDKRQARAFEAFAADSGAELLRIATLLTSDPHIAEDVYQKPCSGWPRGGPGWTTPGRSAAG